MAASASASASAVTPYESFERQMLVYGGDGIDFLEQFPEQRHIDLFARLQAFVGGSLCVANAFVNGQLIVAANELYAGSNNNAVIQGVANSQGYFFKTLQQALMIDLSYLRVSDVYDHIMPPLRQGKLPVVLKSNPIVQQLLDARREMVGNMCLHALSQSELRISASSLRPAAEYLIDNCILHDRGLDVYRKEDEWVASQFNCSTSAVMYMYTLFNDVHETFKIIERDFGRPAEITKYLDFITTVSLSSETDPRIILIGQSSAEPHKGIHAEAQIISFLIQQPTTVIDLMTCEPIYIGISKKCCLDCHRLISSWREINLL